jgi:hypothetical protein
MKYLIAITFFLFSSLAFSQVNLFISIPHENIYLVNAKKLCGTNSSLRFCIEHGRHAGEKELFCNSKKYNCEDNKNLFSLKQYVLDESNLSSECIIAIDANKIYKNGKLAKFYVTSAIETACEI